jgi:hypothetical protein
LLKIIEHQQTLFVGQLVLDLLHEWALSLLAQAQGIGQGGNHQIGVDDRVEGNETGAVNKVGTQVCGGLECQARLARPTRPCDGHKAHIGMT